MQASYLSAFQDAALWAEDTHTHCLLTLEASLTSQLVLLRGRESRAESAPGHWCPAAPRLPRFHTALRAQELVHLAVTGDVLQKLPLVVDDAGYLFGQLPLAHACSQRESFFLQLGAATLLLSQFLDFLPDLVQTCARGPPLPGVGVRLVLVSDLDLPQAGLFALHFLSVQLHGVRCPSGMELDLP